MKTTRLWRQSAATIACTNPGAKRFRVRELRQARWYFNACEAKEENHASNETAEAEQAKRLAFSLSAPSAFRSLSLFLFVCQPIPCEATTSNLTADDSEAVRISQLAPVVAERLLVKITEQVERLDADVCALKLPFHETPEVLHRVRV